LPASVFLTFLFLLLSSTTTCRADTPAAQVGTWIENLNDALVNWYENPAAAPAPTVPANLASLFGNEERPLLTAPPTANAPYPLQVGQLRARLQQAIVLEMAQATREGRVSDAQSWRAELMLPRGVSASEGALILANLPAGQPQRADAARVLVREAITWETARVRQLLAAARDAAAHPDVPMPGRLAEELGEASTLTDIPPALCHEANLTTASLLNPSKISTEVAQLNQLPWEKEPLALSTFCQNVETHLPSLLSDTERHRHERMLLKLVTIIPREYAGGVRDGQITTPLEYREAVSFTAQAKQFTDELAPIWLAEQNGALRDPLEKLQTTLAEAQAYIAVKKSPDGLGDILSRAQKQLEGPFAITLHRGGTTADIVDEVMLETRSLLGQSLAAANDGRWSEAESLRLEAYTTYDPDLEARLMPRDPQLATDIEHLLLDGLDQPGVKALLDRRVGGAPLEQAYSRVSAGLDRAGALLKSGVSPTAAALNAGSIVLREGLEGLLVIVAILAGLRGDENRRKRLMIWFGVVLSFVATLITVVLSQTVITRLHYYGETIEAVTSILAILILLLITNWLFQQIYWRQWVCTLKSQAEGDTAWQLITVGFLIGYREGFETVLFIQSLMMDVGGAPVSLGVGVGLVILFILGFAALAFGLKLPYFKLLLGTAFLIGMVLIMFVGTGVRSMQTVGWLPVHKLLSGSWPAWTGQWLGLYNSVETLAAQILTTAIVLGTWGFSRYRAKRASALRRAAMATRKPAPLVVLTNNPQECGHSDNGACGLDFENPADPCHNHREPDTKPQPSPVSLTIQRNIPANASAE
jgi:high-affinity iron transporter